MQTRQSFPRREQQLYFGFASTPDPVASECYPLHPLSYCIGGHFTEPYEQNTQQSPGLGRSRVLQLPHS